MKLKTKNVVMENQIKINSKLNPNIGRSVSIAVVNTIQKLNKIKLLNRKIEIQNEMMEN